MNDYYYTLYSYHKMSNVQMKRQLVKSDLYHTKLVFRLAKRFHLNRSGLAPSPRGIVSRGDDRCHLFDDIHDEYYEEEECKEDKESASRPHKEIGGIINVVNVMPVLAKSRHEIFLL